MHDIHTLQSTLRTLIDQVTDLDIEDVSDDFFAHGMDSLHVINLAKGISSSIIGPAGPSQSIESKLIYDNPSIDKLAAAILGHLESASTNGASGTKPPISRISKMQELLEKYTADLPVIARPPTIHRGKPLTVLLTGSTGSLGPFIFDALLANSSVKKIYCLNRSVNGEERQKSQNLSKALSSDWSPERVEFLQSDFSQEYLGLGPSTYSTLLETITHIIHNAWPVDFNRSLSSFATPHISFVRQLIDLSTRNAAHIFFVSSVSTVMAWNANHAGPVPEAIIEDFSVPEAMGYAESKHVAERLLDTANRVAGIPCTVVRVGQVAGPIDPKHGTWNRREWLPSLIPSSKFLGKIPGDLGAMNMIDWIPVDVLGKVLVELLVADRDADKAPLPSNPNARIPDESPSPVASHSNTTDKVAATRVYHVLNPHPVPWPSLLPTVLDSLKPSAPNLETVPFSAWVSALSEHAPTATTMDDDDPTSLDRNPALKLLAFYQSAQKSGGGDGQVSSFEGFEMTRTVQRSEGLRELGSVREEWMRGWMEGWGF